MDFAKSKAHGFQRQAGARVSKGSCRPAAPPVSVLVRTAHRVCYNERRFSCRELTVTANERMKRRRTMRSQAVGSEKHTVYPGICAGVSTSHASFSHQPCRGKFCLYTLYSMLLSMRNPCDCEDKLLHWVRTHDRLPLPTSHSGFLRQACISSDVVGFYWTFRGRPACVRLPQASNTVPHAGLRLTVATAARLLDSRSHFSSMQYLKNVYHASDLALEGSTQLCGRAWAPA